MGEKQAAIGDLHYSLYSQDELVDYRGLRISNKLASIDRAFRFVLQTCRDREIKVLNLCGDVFHNKSVVHVDAVNLFLDSCEDYPDIDKIIVDGNHDMSARTENGRSAIRMIRNEPSIRRIKPPFETIDNRIYVPWNHSIKTVISQNRSNILLSHFGLNEAVLSSGISHVSDVKMSDLDGLYDLVICGHYHKPQDIVSSRCRFYYTGSLIQLDWGESGEEKRFLIFDTETLDVESIPIDCVRKFVKLEVTNENKKEMFEKFHELTEQGHKVKLFTVDKIVDAPKDVIIVDKSEKDSIDRGIDSSMSQIQKLIKYLDIENINEDEIDEYLEKAKDILANTVKDEGSTTSEFRQVNFKKITYRNFLGTIDEFEYDFEDSSLSLIVGKNGIGKSTIFKALYFALYGSLPDKAVVDSIVNKKTKKDMYVCLDFEVIEGGETKVFKLERFKKVKGKADGAVLDGPIPGNGSEEVTKIIERLVMPKKVFTNTRMFTQKVKDFFTALNDADQKEIFRKVLSLDEYTLYYKSADTKIKEVKSEFNDLEYRIKENMSLITSHNSLLSELELKRTVFDRDKWAKISECDEEVKKFENCKQSILDKYPSIHLISESDKETIQREYATINLQIQNLQSEKSNEESDLKSKKDTKISELKLAANDTYQKDSESWIIKGQNLVAQFNSELNKLQTKLNTLIQSTTGYSVRIQNYKNEIITAKANIKKYEISLSQEDSLCPECGQSLTDQCKKDFSEKLDRLNQSLLTIEPSLRDEEQALKLINDDIEKVKRMISESQIDKDKKESEIKNEILKIKNEVQARLTEALRKLDEMCSSKQKQISDKYDMKQIELNEAMRQVNVKYNEISEILKAKQSIQTIENTISSQIEKKNQIIESTFDDSMIVGIQDKVKSMIESMTQLNTEKMHVQRNIDIYEFWKDAFSPSGIPSMLIDEAIPFMNSKIKDYLDIISDNRYIVSFDTITETQKGQIKDKINVKLLDTETMNDDLNTMSGGQQRIIDISTILTFGDLQTSMQNVDFNVLVFDEIFDSLDDENSELVAKALKRLTKTGKSINVISHTHVDQIEANRILDMNVGLFLG